MIVSKPRFTLFYRLFNINRRSHTHAHTHAEALAEAEAKDLSGFTLVELSIVIVIIGLIIAGVVAGNSMVLQAKLQSVISGIRQYEMAINTFKLQYNTLPGDMSNAQSYWGVSVGNGNNNKYIDVAGAPNEHYWVWQHLGNNGAKLIPGSYNATGNIAAGVNVPAASTFGVFSFVSTYASPHFGIQNTTAMTVTGTGGGIDYCTWCYPAFLPAYAKNIDLKIDDGIANLGQLHAIDGNGAGVNSCSAQYNVTAGADYNLVTTTPACRIFYHLNKAKR